jgi:hypothetical protein
LGGRGERVESGSGDDQKRKTIVIIVEDDDEEVGDNDDNDEQGDSGSKRRSGKSCPDAVPDADTPTWDFSRHVQTSTGLGESRVKVGQADPDRQLRK